MGAMDLGCEKTNCKAAEQAVEPCDAKVIANKDLGTCCADVRKYGDCFGKECFQLYTAYKQMEADKQESDTTSSDKDASPDQWRTACPDAGLPSAAEVAKVMNEDDGGPATTSGA